MIFTRMSEDVMDALQLNAGVILSNYDPNTPFRVPLSSEIVATTTGGINTVCEPTYEDFAEDVDNAPNNMKEFKRLTGWNCSMSFTSIKFNAVNTAWSLGASDTSTLTNGVKKIVPRRDVLLTDFRDLWWVGDKANGGAFAVKLIDALSTGGLNIQSTKNAKGTNQMTLTGHVSISNQDRVPMEFYDIPAQSELGENTYYSVVQNLTHVESSFTLDATQDTDFECTLAAETGYEISSVVVKMDNTDITATAYDDSTGEVEIVTVTGPIEITAVATESESP